ncbi:patatin-like phospholipase family protein [Bacillus tianshenii]|nr:patatin-like phospholipase family protein [Bacillus tianshenii]
MRVDGVFSGGGMKAIALVGALEVVEERRIQFERLAGTSAGALVAALIAAGYTSSEITELLDDLDTKQFLDAPKTPFLFIKWLRLYWKLGLYKGNELEEWVEERLRQKGIQTFADLPDGKLRIIASNLTRGEMVVLPDDLHKYGLRAGSFSVAKAVRMSCSIPYFFQPVKLYSVNGEKNIIVDGGVLSNFPVWLFMNEKRRPVLGVKLSANMESMPKHRICNGLEMYNALFATMKDAHDARYISSAVEKNIIFIPVSSVVTTEFNMDEEKKHKLMKLGRMRAEAFFKTWSC